MAELNIEQQRALARARARQRAMAQEGGRAPYGGAGGEFERMAAGMDPQQRREAQMQDNLFGQYLRDQAAQPREGESEQDRQRRLYGSMDGMTEPVVRMTEDGRGYVAEDTRPGMGEGMGRAAFQGATFAAGDEAVAAGAAGIDALTGAASFGDAYDARLDAERRKIEQFREDSPTLAYGSEMVGAVPTAMLPMGAVGRVTQTGPLAQRMLASGTIGAGQGTVYGFNAGEGVEDRAGQALAGGAFGGMVGAAAPVLADGVERGARSVIKANNIRQTAKGAPTTQQLRQNAGRAYQRAKDAGVEIAPDSWRRAVSDLTATLQDEAIDPTLHPKAMGILKRFQDAADGNGPIPPVTTLRRLAANVAGSADPDEARLGRIMVDSLDDYVARLGPNDVLAGDPSQLSDDLIGARDQWRRYRRSEMVDQALDKAENQASGYENGIRIQFRQILNNPNRRRGLTADEIEAMEMVVRGTPLANVARRLGRLSAGSGQQHNMLNAMLGSGMGAGVGGSVGGPIGAGVGAVALPALGYGAQKAAEGLTARNARLAQALIASGGLPPMRPVDPNMGRLARLLLERNVPYTAQAREAVYQ